MPWATHKEFFEKVQRQGDFSCSFCGRLRTNVDKLISGPLVFICRDCVVGFCRAAPEAGQQGVTPCSFCRRLPGDVEFTVGNATSAICDGCLDICRKILDEEGMPVPDDTRRPTKG